MEKKLTSVQAAKILGITKARVNQFVRAGRLKAELFGRVYIFDPAEVKRFSKIKRPLGRPLAKE